MTFTSLHFTSYKFTERDLGPLRILVPLKGWKYGRGMENSGFYAMLRNRNAQGL